MSVILMNHNYKEPKEVMRFKNDDEPTYKEAEYDDIRPLISTGISIPPGKVDSFEGKEVVYWPSSSNEYLLFKKAFVEIYFPKILQLNGYRFVELSGK